MTPENTDQKDWDNNTFDVPAIVKTLWDDDHTHKKDFVTLCERLKAFLPLLNIADLIDEE